MNVEDPEKMGDNGVSFAKAPELIRTLAWLLDLKNWQKYWKLILSAVVLISIIPLLQFVNSGKSIEPSPTAKVASRDLLSDSEVRFAVEKALHGDDAAKAVAILSGQSDSPIKRQECDHVFNYLLKNKVFNNAETLVDQCWKGNAKVEKLAQLAHEKLKQ